MSCDSLRADGNAVSAVRAESIDLEELSEYAVGADRADKNPPPPPVCETSLHHHSGTSKSKPSSLLCQCYFFWFSAAKDACLIACGLYMRMHEGHRSSRSHAKRKARCTNLIKDKGKLSIALYVSIETSLGQRLNHGRDAEGGMRTCAPWGNLSAGMRTLSEVLQPHMYVSCLEIVRFEHKHVCIDMLLIGPVGACINVAQTEQTNERYILD